MTTIPDAQKLADLLLPCPFCDGKAYLKHEPGSWGYYPDRWSGRCKSCHAETMMFTNDVGSSNVEAKYKAIAAWNTRSPLSAPIQGEAAELVKRLREYVAEYQGHPRDVFIECADLITRLSAQAAVARKMALSEASKVCEQWRDAALKRGERDLAHAYNMVFEEILALSPSLDLDAMVERATKAVTDGLAMRDADYTVRDEDIARAVLSSMGMKKEER